MVSAIFVHVDHVVHPRDHPVTDGIAVFPVHRLSTAHNNSGKKRFGERPYPVEISHLLRLPSLKTVLQPANADETQDD